MNSLFFVLFKGKLKKIRQSRVIDEEIEIIEEENNGEEQDMDRFKQSVIEEEVSKIPVLSRSNVLFQTFQGRYLGNNACIQCLLFMLDLVKFFKIFC